MENRIKINSLQLFGGKLRAIRESKSLSIAELSAMTKIEINQLELIESGIYDPTYTILDELAKALELTVVELFNIVE